MKNIQRYFNKIMSKFILNYSAQAVFSSCSAYKNCQKKITADLKSSLKAACGDK